MPDYDATTPREFIAIMTGKLLAIRTTHETFSDYETPPKWILEELENLEKEFKTFLKMEA